MLSAELLMPAVSVFLFSSQAHRTWHLHLIFYNPSSAKAITTCTLSATQKHKSSSALESGHSLPMVLSSMASNHSLPMVFLKHPLRFVIPMSAFFSVLLWNYLLFTNINIPQNLKLPFLFLLHFPQAIFWLCNRYICWQWSVLQRTAVCNMVTRYLEKEEPIRSPVQWITHWRYVSPSSQLIFLQKPSPYTKRSISVS